MLYQRILRISLRKLNLLLMREVQVIQAKDQCVQLMLLPHLLGHIGNESRFPASLHAIEANEHGRALVLEAVDEVLLVGFGEEGDDMFGFVVDDAGHDGCYDMIGVLVEC